MKVKEPDTASEPKAYSFLWSSVEEIQQSPSHCPHPCRKTASPLYMCTFTLFFHKHDTIRFVFYKNWNHTWLYAEILENIGAHKYTRLGGWDIHVIVFTRANGVMDTVIPETNINVLFGMSIIVFFFLGV